MPIRETFWNVPHWAEVMQYVLGLVAVLIFVIGTTIRIRKWRIGQPEKRTDQLGKRLWFTISQAIGQLRIVEDVYAGIMHLMIFWGMFALLLGTILATIDWDVTHLFFNSQFLTDGIYIIYELVLDILGVFLIIGLGLAAYRRYILKPSLMNIKNKPNIRADDAYAIIVLTLIALTGYLIEGLRIAVIQPDWAKWSPIGNLIAKLLVNMDVAGQQTFHVVVWIIHALLAFGFIASVPFTKLFHLVSTPLNIFFHSTNMPGRLAPVRDTGTIGVKKLSDFTWKQILDIEACIRCGRCVENCPIYSSGLNFSSRDAFLKLRSHLAESKNGKEFYRDVITPDDVWACTTCYYCVQVCPVFSDYVSSVVDMRRNLVVEGQVENELQDALSNFGRYGNSFGQSPRARARWSEPIQPKLADARRQAVEYLWFVGDYASYSPALTEITQLTAEVFNRAGLDYGILYDAEQNAGNDVRRIGEEGLFEMLVEKNARALERVDCKAVVTTDPHTYNTLKNEYPAYLYRNLEVVHYTELLEQLIQQDKLKIKNPLNLTVTYHDPCYLGRYNEVYDAPRFVIEATGCTLVEMPRNRSRALCCGAGGGRIWMQEGEITERPSEIRIKEAASLPGVEALVVACPKDVTMYLDAVKTTGHEDQLVVKDLIELVAEATWAA